MFFNKVQQSDVVDISYEDFKELERLYAKATNPIVKKILGEEVKVLRSKFVTKLLNQEIDDGFVDDPPKPPEKKSFDEMAYFARSIRGWTAKLRSLKEISPDTPTAKIKDVLVRCHGREDDAVGALLGGEMPKKREVPAELLEEHESRYQEAYKKYEKKLEEFHSRKRKLFPDLDISMKTESYEERASMLKQKISRLKAASKSLSSKRIVQQMDLPEEENQLYLPGEMQARMNDEPRVFTFKSERTFSNEVHHIHFRIAESQFHRICKSPNFCVKEVSYIVTQHLTRAYEGKRAEFEENGRGNKQYLMFAGLEEGKYPDRDTFEWIKMNGFSPESFKGGRVFSVRLPHCAMFMKDVTYTAPQMNRGYNYQQQQPPPNRSEVGKEEEKRILLCLVSTGREKKSTKLSDGHGKTYKRPSGFDSLVNDEGSHIVVFDTKCVLPFYVVQYERKVMHQYQTVAPGQTAQKQGNKHLDEEWTEMKKSAEADKQMDDIKKFYSTQLRKKEMETKAGKIDPSKNEWMVTMIQKKAEAEKRKMGIEEESPLIMDGDDMIYDFETPVSAEGSISDGIFGVDSPTSPILTPGDFEGEFDEEQVFEVEEDKDVVMKDKDEVVQKDQDKDVVMKDKKRDFLGG